MSNVSKKHILVRSGNSNVNEFTGLCCVKLQRNTIMKQYDLQSTTIIAEHTRTNLSAIFNLQNDVSAVYNVIVLSILSS